MTKTTAPKLTHAANCPTEAPRVDVTNHPDAGLSTHHCVDCGAHATFRTADGTIVPTPRVTGAHAVSQDGAA